MLAAPSYTFGVLQNRFVTLAEHFFGDCDHVGLVLERLTATLSLVLLPVPDFDPPTALQPAAGGLFALGNDFFQVPLGVAPALTGALDTDNLFVVGIQRYQVDEVKKVVTLTERFRERRVALNDPD